MNFISERIKIVGTGIKSIRDLAIGVNHLGGSCFQIRITIYILRQNLSIAKIDPSLS
jgi:hypothetical protein